MKVVDIMREGLVVALNYADSRTISIFYRKIDHCGICSGGWRRLDAGDTAGLYTIPVHPDVV